MDALPYLKELQAIYTQWLRDTNPIWQDFHENQFIFGIGALKQIDDYPYIESVHPRDLRQ